MDLFDELYDIPQSKYIGGRPTIYSQELVDQICGMAAEGKTIRSICLLADMPARPTIIRWLTETDKTALRFQYEAAYKTQMLVVFDELKDIMEECDVADIAKVWEYKKICQQPQSGGLAHHANK